MRRRSISPITDVLDSWPLAGAYRMRWGRDEAGQMWVTVENGDGDCEAVLPYETYLDMAGGDVQDAATPTTLR